MSILARYVFVNMTHGFWSSRNYITFRCLQNISCKLEIRRTRHTMYFVRISLIAGLLILICHPQIP